MSKHLKKPKAVKAKKPSPSKILKPKAKPAEPSTPW